MTSLGLWETHFLLVNRIEVFLGTLLKDIMSLLPSMLPFYRKGKENPEGTLITRLPVATP